MTGQRLQCIYVDHEPQAYKCYNSERHVDNITDRESPRLATILRSLAQSFDTVHVCSNAADAMRVLHSSFVEPNTYTCALVSLTTDMLNRSSTHRRLGMDMATNYQELDEIAIAGVNHLRGLELLRHINLVRVCLRANDVQTAAYSPNLNLEMVLRIKEAGTQTIIEDAELVQALDQFVLKIKVESVAQRKVLDVTPDPAQYENEDVRPSREQWNGLRSRIQSFYASPSSLRAGILDLHMPQYKPPVIHDASYFSSEAFLSQIPHYQKLVSTWNFTTLHVEEAELMNCAMVIFKHVLALPEVAEWRLSDADLFSFIDAIRRSYYTTNPYHNFRHAVDVLQAVFYMLLSAEYLPKMNADCPTFKLTRCPVLGMLMTPQYMLGACIVGIGHDVGHPGVNNAFLVATKAPLALLYNDRSVLENFHCASLSRMLTLLWPATQTSNMRKVIIELILSTDMALHFDYMSRFKEMETICLAQRALDTDEGSEPRPLDIAPATKEKYQVTLFSALIKCGDISNVARPFAISRDWSHALLREFFNQARLEKTMELPVTKNFDPEQTAQADSQTFFINLFAHPLFVSLEKVLPNLQPISQLIRTNRDTWKNNGIPLPVSTPVKPGTPVGQVEDHDLARPLEKVDDSTFSTRNVAQIQIPLAKSDIVPASDMSEKTIKTKKSFCIPQIFRKKRRAVEQE